MWSSSMNTIKLMYETYPTTYIRYYCQLCVQYYYIIASSACVLECVNYVSRILMFFFSKIEERFDACMREVENRQIKMFDTLL